MSHTHLISVAPMMDCTDRHDRYFLRLLAPNILLYSEMITASALHHGDANYLLQFNREEHPIALQLGGSDTALLTQAARLGEEAGYDEINLNVGCPSARVKSGQFGACLMMQPDLVARCVQAMRKAVSLPVTVKCRIGVDDHDSYEALTQFIRLVSNAGCDTFIIHARKAWLSGLSPKENRHIPPLQYEVVYQLKRDFPHLTIIINGGIKSVDEIKAHLVHVDGVMIGREAYANPYFLTELQQTFYPATSVISRHESVQKMIPYIHEQLKHGVRLSAISRHMLGLYQGLPGARQWRRYLSQHAHLPGADAAVVEEAAKAVEGAIERV